jgi:SAM-dependent methyltransferase
LGGRARQRLPAAVRRRELRLHHDRALEELSRVLKPGGLLAVSVPREGPEAMCWLLSRQYRTSPGGHVRIYRRSELRKKIERHGYSVYASHFAHGLHSPYWWLRCAVGLEKENLWPVRLYHRLLVWDLMQRPWITRVLERVLNPLFGKSVVFYAVKTSDSGVA